MKNYKTLKEIKLKIFKSFNDKLGNLFIAHYFWSDDSIHAKIQPALVGFASYNIYHNIYNIIYYNIYIIIECFCLVCNRKFVGIFHNDSSPDQDLRDFCFRRPSLLHTGFKQKILEKIMSNRDRKFNNFPAWSKVVQKNLPGCQIQNKKNEIFKFIFSSRFDENVQKI